MPGRSLTILQLTHQGGGSGSTVAIANLSRQLARRGHRVLIGCRPGTMLAGLARDAGLEVVPLDFRRLGPLATALDAVMVREAVDVANSNATRDRRALTWLRWRRRLPRPFVVTRHTMPLTLAPELIAVALSADRTIAVSPAVARALRRRLHPGARVYTFWEYTRGAWGRDWGLRIDHLLLNPAAAGRLAAAGVDRVVRGWEKTSDHAPAWVELRDA